MSTAPKSPKGASLSEAAVRAPTLSAATIDLPRSPQLIEAESQTPRPPRSDLLVGCTVDGRYIIERVLGEGGMGVVYAGRHRVIEKRVAIKVLRADLATDNELNERFLQEARAASAIGNPHIVDIIDFGQLPDGSTYFVMELLDGKSLGDEMARPSSPLTVARICHVAKQMAQGLSAAHAANIVHRDLKPDNVMLVQRGAERDFVKILDFGIAKVGTGTKRMTRAGSVFGTPHYMSPEQAAGAAVDHRTDIYALGVILYEMATGRVPFDADNFMGILTQHMYKAPVPIRVQTPERDIPAGLDAIVQKCLTKKPEGRYASMDALLSDLGKLEQGQLPDAVHELMARSGSFDVPADYFRAHAASTEAVTASPLEPKKRWPVFAAMAALAMTAGIGGVAVASRAASGRSPTVSVPAPPPQPGSAANRAPAPPPVEPPPPAPVKHEVLVSAVPADATIARDGVALGQSPVALQLGDAEDAVLVVTRKGYKTRTVHVDPSGPKVTVTLENSAGAGKSTVAKPAPAGPMGIDDVGDPFAKRGGH
jgi:serine/threonine-protein kinase